MEKKYQRILNKYSLMTETKRKFLFEDIRESMNRAAEMARIKDLGISRCCGSRVTIEGNTTRYFVCSKCNKACDAHIRSSDANI